MNILYSTQATAVGGRGGWVGSVDGALRVKLSTPPALGGRGGPGSNPEQLFAAAYAACFIEAIRVAAAELGLEVTDDANVTATVGVGHPDDDPKLALRIGLSVDLAGMDQVQAEALVARADALCPYSRALREVVEVRIQVS
jgi:osmotically inducible protein OsmC